jgi:hypothetical protein
LIFGLTSCLSPKKQSFGQKINCSQMKLPNFVSPSGESFSKIGHDFSKKIVQKLKLSINTFHKKCAPKQLFFNEKKSVRFG